MKLDRSLLREMIFRELTILAEAADPKKVSEIADAFLERYYEEAIAEMSDGEVESLVDVMMSEMGITDDFDTLDAVMEELEARGKHKPPPVPDTRVISKLPTMYGYGPALGEA